MMSSMMSWKQIAMMLAVPAALCAQAPRGGMFPWWDSPVANTLNLSESQQSQIRAVVRDYRGRMLEARTAVEKAETELENVFNEEFVDQRRGAEAIDQLVKARSEMTKAVSEMSLRLRAVLTPQQWQDLQSRQPGPERNVGRSTGRGPERGGGGPGGRRRAPKGPPAAKSQPQAPKSPVLN